MAVFNYAKPKANATKMLTRYGQSVVITSHVIGAYNPDTGSSTDTTSTQTGVGVIFEWGKQGSSPSYGKSMIDTSSILTGDKQLYLSATGITTPNIGDTITDINGSVYTIIMLKELAPSGVTVLIECNVRGI